MMNNLKSPKGSLLIVDDNPCVRIALEGLLTYPE